MILIKADGEFSRGNISISILSSLLLSVLERYMTTHWPKEGPASYFPSIEKKYGRSIFEWQEIILACGKEKHMEIVAFLKADYSMGHGHANALVGWTLAGHRAS